MATEAPLAAPQRRMVAGPQPTAASAAAELDILIVVSKMKKYIRDASGMACSDGVAEELSHHVRQLCDVAIAAARRAERKTVLDRDVPPVRS